MGMAVGDFIENLKVKAMTTVQSRNFDTGGKSRAHTSHPYLDRLDFSVFIRGMGY
jgi:hypothetical protein